MAKYRFVKDEKGDKIWWVEFEEAVYGEMLFSFDKKKIFNFWGDYPDKLTPEQKALFDKENPDLANLK